MYMYMYVLEYIPVTRKKINSTQVLNASVLVQRSTEPAQTTHAIALMLSRSHSHVHVGRFVAVEAGAHCSWWQPSRYM